MLAADDVRARIAGEAVRGEHVLPAPFGFGVRVLARQRKGQIDCAIILKVGRLL
jgi:hypothetical protein